MELNIPIETDRLLLDNFKKTDWDNHFDLVNSKAFQRFNCSKYKPLSDKKKEKIIKTVQSQSLKGDNIRFMLTIRLKEDGTYIGHMGFKEGSLAPDGCIELFYAISEKFWNQGYGTETLQAVIKTCFESLELHRIFAGCDIDNHASARIMEKAGMMKESHWRKDRLRQGVWKDGVGYSILRDDYVI